MWTMAPSRVLKTLFSAGDDARVLVGEDGNITGPTGTHFRLRPLNTIFSIFLVGEDGNDESEYDTLGRRRRRPRVSSVFSRRPRIPKREDVLVGEDGKDMRGRIHSRLATARAFRRAMAETTAR